LRKKLLTCRPSVCPMRVYRDKIAEVSIVYCDKRTGPSLRCVCIVTKWPKLGSRIAKKLLTCRPSVCPMRVYCDKIAEVSIVYCDKRTGPSLRCVCIVTKWPKLGSRIAKKTTDMSSVRLSDVGVL